MNKIIKWVVLVALLIGLEQTLVRAQTTGPYELINGYMAQVVKSSGGGYVLNGSFDSGNAVSMRGGEFVVAAEEARTTDVMYRVHLPVVVR